MCLRSRGTSRSICSGPKKAAMTSAARFPGWASEMGTFFYDLHVHSCLSPCAQDDMTPHNIAGMAKLNGLHIVALTDHNSAKNCPAFEDACAEYGVVAVGGMELTTAEDIHLVCLFESTEQAQSFERDLQSMRTLVKNKPALMGNQNIVDAQDSLIGTEEYLLPIATSLSLRDAYAFADSHGALLYPAHVDRPSNGIIAVLGTYPDEPPFAAAEFRDEKSLADCRKRYPALKKVRPLFCSDAHCLLDLNEAEHSLRLDCPQDAPPEEIRRALFRCLREEKK
ncbi:MAG: PHP domain-containing protein [Oscillospiraceae bacterium]|nr:PHP domain-containing protein [Oscillospiraceae bacterium]